MKAILLFLGLGVCVCIGCGGAEAPKTKHSAEQTKDSAAGEADAPEKANVRAKEERREPADRKIIYTAHLSLIVEDMPKAEEALLELVQKHKGLVASAALTGSTGSPRQGTWRVRIPVNQLQTFVRAVVELGVPETNKLDSEDVTERYHDLEASIKTYKASEEALRKLLDKSVGKVEDVLAVERELAARREKLEQLEGQRRRLANLTSLTTVHITFREIKDYVPPQAPSFGSSVSGTFSDSIAALVSFGKGVVLVAVALAPWLPLIVLIVVPSWVAVRRWRKRVGTA